MDETTPLAAIEFLAEGVSLTYVRVPADIRKNGLMWHHRVLVPNGSDYDDEIDALHDAALALLSDVLDDEDRAEPIDPPTEDEEDEDDD